MTITEQLAYGDGRRRMQIPDYIKELQADGRLSVGCPKPVRIPVARMIIQAFAESGCSTHSWLGSTLWIVVGFCIEHNIPYREEQAFGHGYAILGDWYAPNRTNTGQ